MIRVMVVDDQRLVRACLCHTLSSTGEIEVVAEAASGEEARQLARELQLDVVLMDLNMPGIGGVEATRRLMAGCPRVRILAVSQYFDGPYPIRFLEAGGTGYVSKHASPEELISAVKKVSAGREHLSHDVAMGIALGDYPSVACASPARTLSRRELQVLQGLAGGQRPEQVATALHLSPKTVATHRRRLLKKLGAQTDVELVNRARGLRLVD